MLFVNDMTAMFEIYFHITLGSTYIDEGEIANLLCKMGMYDEAIQVCMVYKLTLSPVFESLAFRLVLYCSKVTNANMLSLNFLILWLFIELVFYTLSIQYTIEI